MKAQGFFRILERTAALTVAALLVFMLSGCGNNLGRLYPDNTQTSKDGKSLSERIAEWEKEKVQLEAEGKRKKNFEVKEPYASDVSEGKSNPVYTAHTYHTKVPHPAIMRYILHYTQPGDVILDGFAGTGMTGVAAQACGNPDIDTKDKINN